MILAQLHLTLPPWVHDEVDADRSYPDADSRVALAIHLSRRNVEHRTGGPFGAAVFRDDRLIGVAQPCAMCYGALVWAGVDELLIAATADDVQTLAGFDEGPLPADWTGELERRGIAVHQGLMREHARDVLRDYGESGVVY